MFLGRYSILDVKVSACDYIYVINEIIEAAISRRHLAVVPISTHPVTISHIDKKLNYIFNQCDLILPDSQYVRWALSFLYGIQLKDRVYGPELFLKACKTFEKKGLSMFLYGNNISRVKKGLKKRYPKLRIINSIDLEYRQIGESDINELKLQLRKAKPHLLAVGIGSPAQHYLLDELRNQNIPILAVGAAFDFISGIKPQAPLWMRNWGLEWLFRLITEPKRLWKRYLILGPLFLLLVLIQKLKTLSAK